MHEHTLDVIQFNDLLEAQDKANKMYKRLEKQAKDSFGDGTNPNLTLHLIVDCLKTASTYLNMAVDHHNRELL